jgi:hypothetical protein
VGYQRVRPSEGPLTLPVRRETRRLARRGLNRVPSIVARAFAAQAEQCVADEPDRDDGDNGRGKSSMKAGTIWQAFADLTRYDAATAERALDGIAEEDIGLAQTLAVAYPRSDWVQRPAPSIQQFQQRDQQAIRQAQHGLVQQAVSQRFAELAKDKSVPEGLMDQVKEVLVNARPPTGPLAAVKQIEDTARTIYALRQQADADVSDYEVDMFSGFEKRLQQCGVLSGYSDVGPNEIPDEAYVDHAVAQLFNPEAAYPRASKSKDAEKRELHDAIDRAATDGSPRDPDGETLSEWARARQRELFE